MKFTRVCEFSNSFLPDLYAKMRCSLGVKYVAQKQGVEAKNQILLTQFGVVVSFSDKKKSASAFDQKLSPFQN